MSRYIIPSFDPAFEIVIGWDWPLKSFFAQVLDTRLTPGDEGYARLWIGGTFDEIQNPEELQAPIASYADLTDEMLATLRADRGY
jgi:hypothetical protein